MTRYAVPIADLDVIWNTRAGAALVEMAVLDRDAEDAEVVSVEGIEVLVLDGPEAEVAALVSGLARAPLPGAGGRRARVYAEEATGWRPAATIPTVPDLPDEAPIFGVGEAAS